MRTKEEKAAYQRAYYLNNLEARKLQSNQSYHKNKKPKRTQTIEERNKVANDSYHRNKEKLSAMRKIKYLESKGIIVKEKKEIVEPVKRTLSIHEILNTLRKDLKHDLWNKSVRQWSKSDWEKFNLL